MAKVGSTHLRSLGLRAGRKKASISQKMMGLHTTTDANSETMTLTEKPSKALVV